MQGTTMRRAGLALAVATALTALAACTSPESSDRPGEEQRASRGRSLTALRAAERATERARSARVESTMTMGELMSMTADGILAWGDGITGTMTIRYTGGTLADTLRGLGTTSMEARYLPDAYYARMGEEFAARAGGKRWIRYAYDDLRALAGGSGAHLGDQMRRTTPNQSVRLLLACEDVRKAGEETVRGRTAAHYSGTVATADVTDPALKKRLTEAGVTAETVDIWIDERNLLVKKVEKAEMTAGRMTQTAHYGDYGARARAERPPLSDTADFEELVGKHAGTP
ncbi:hypothetical protein [Streptomyces djakartensis]|uniref:Lipoprotein n=1 Tax=Streptomyces djakartensis TaxID=68193 RepID=A0ABQ2Z7P3_9ACTN|nr:hypothetical protein [Streptomyces djakartensis]GGY03859.1 putative lipoprotein [Streptomyces djakartensis]